MSRNWLLSFNSLLSTAGSGAGTVPNPAISP